MLQIIQISLYAQSIHDSNIDFNYLTNEHGLSQNNVSAILQDHEGFIWFGTWSGLNKYDGYSFEVFTHIDQDSTSLSNNSVRVLFQDSDNNLLIGTDNGLNIFDPSAYNFIRVRDNLLPAGIKGNCSITTIYEDTNGTIWVLSDLEGIHLAKKEKNEPSFRYVKTLPNKTTYLFEDNYGAICEDVQGNLLIGTSKSGLGTFYRMTGKYQVIKNDTGPRRNLAIMSIHKSSNGKIWLGRQNNGIYRYFPDDQRFHVLSNCDNALNEIEVGTIWKLYEDKQQRVWVCTDRGGLYMLDTRSDCITKVHIRDSGSRTPTAIYDIYESRDGVLWIGTYSQGIGYYNKRVGAFRHYTNIKEEDNSLSYNVVRAIDIDSKGQIWIGTDRGGLNRFDPLSSKFQHFLPDASNNNTINSEIVRSLCVDHTDNIWIGTLVSGLNIYNQKDNDFTAYQYDPSDTTGLSNNKINGIYQDENLNIWIGTQQGINRVSMPGEPQKLNYQKLTFEHFQHHDDRPGSISSNSVYAFHQDAEHRMWVGTLNGLNLYDPKEKVFYHQNNNPNNYPVFSTDFVHCIEEDNYGNILAGTRNNGLYIIASSLDSMRHITEADGLVNNTVYGIIADHHGDYWITTGNGLSKYNLEEAHFTNYHKYDGLQDNEFRLNAYDQMENGQIIIGGINGFNIFHPDSISKNKFVPPIVLTDFKVLNQSIVPGENAILKKHISKTSVIRLKHYKSSISFEYAALNYHVSINNQYAYQLKGLEQNWNYVGKRREAIYTNLPHGEYTFRVKGSNNDGVWNEQGTSIKVIISPPLWLTPGAYLVYLLILLLIFYTIWQYKLKRDQLKLAKMEQEKIREVNQMKFRFFTNISHEIRTPLTLISGPLESIMKEEKLGHVKSNYYMGIIKNNVERLKELIDQLLLFRKIETSELQLNYGNINLHALIRHVKEAFDFLAETHLVDYTLDYNTSIQAIRCDKEKLEKILNNLLSNAFKYAPESGYVKIVVGESHHTVDNTRFIIFQIEDNGINIPEDKLKRIFERFYQVEHDNADRGKTGSGIGLALSKDLAEIMGGTLSVENLFSGGVRFTLKLPYHPPEHNEEQKVQQFPDQIVSVENAPETEIHREVDKAKNTILVIDDNQEIRFYIENTLNDKYNVIHAEDGETGIELAKEQGPDLIVSDVMMPKLDGVTLTKNLKSNIETSHIPLILLTAKTSIENHLEGLNAGANDYIVKPFNSDVLKAKISNLLALKQNIRWQLFRSEHTTIDEINLPDIDKSLIENAFNLIKENLEDPNFDGEALRLKLNLGRTQFFRKMKALTNQTPNEFIREVRLKNAAEILTSGNYTVSQVAYAIGFNDPSHFSRLFKKYYGIPPTEYRGEKQNDD